MSDTADDFVRREVSKLLHVDYRGKFMCASCLLKFAVERFGTTLYTRGRSSGRWPRYSALPAPADEYIDSSATNAGRRCRVSPQRLPVQGSRPDPLSHFLCRLSEVSDQSCRPGGARVHVPFALTLAFMVVPPERQDPANGLLSAHSCAWPRPVGHGERQDCKQKRQPRLQD